MRVPLKTDRARNKHFLFIAFPVYIFSIIIIGSGHYHTGIFVRHLLYVLIAVAILKKGRHGLYLALFTAALLPISHNCFGVEEPMSREVFRSAELIAFSVIALWLKDSASRFFSDPDNRRETQGTVWRELNETRVWFQLLFNSRHDAIFIHYLETNNITDTFLEVNDTACRLLGYTRNELLKLSPADVCTSECTACFPEILKRLRIKNQTICETKYLTKDGRFVHVECRIYMFKLHDKPAVMNIVRNISKKKRLEAELQSYQVNLKELVEVRTRELIEANARLQLEMKKQQETAECLRSSEFRYRSVVKDIPALVCRFVADGTLTFVNHAYCCHFNKTEKELLGKNFFELIPESQRTGARKHLASFSPQTPAISYEHEVHSADGSIRWQHWVDRAFFDSRGTITEYQSVGLDITDRKQAETAIRNTNTVLQTVFNGISEPLFLLDSNLHIKILNEAALTYCNASDTELILNRPCYKAIRSRGIPCSECPIQRAVQTGQKKTLERANPSVPERIELIAAYPLQQNEVCGISGTIVRITDVTKTRKMAQQLIRTNRLSSLGQLSAGIAHEIRNPLAGISLFTDLLRDPKKFSFTEQQIEIIDEIKINVDRISEIVKQVLNFARPQPESRTLTQINDVIRQCFKLWPSKLRKAGIALRLDLDRQLPETYTNSLQMQQVINNLVSNAVEAMPSGGTLAVSTYCGPSALDKTRKVVHIQVKDTGHGIAPENTENIFNPFFTTKSYGTGLGLSIVHNIIESLDGTISAKNDIDRGTVFTVELPIR